MENIPITIVPLYSKNLKNKQLSQKLEKNQSRSLRVFESAIRSEYTKKNYSCTLKKFMEFVEVDDFDYLVDLPEKKIQIMLEDYVIFLKTQNLNPNSFPVMFTGLQLFFSMNDKILNWKKIKKFYPGTIKNVVTYYIEQRHNAIKNSLEAKLFKFIILRLDSNLEIKFEEYWNFITLDNPEFAGKLDERSNKTFYAEEYSEKITHNTISKIFDNKFQSTKYVKSSKRSRQNPASNYHVQV